MPTTLRANKHTRWYFLTLQKSPGYIKSSTKRILMLFIDSVMCTKVYHTRRSAPSTTSSAWSIFIATCSYTRICLHLIGLCARACRAEIHTSNNNQCKQIVHSLCICVCVFVVGFGVYQWHSSECIACGAPCVFLVWECRPLNRAKSVNKRSVFHVSAGAAWEGSTKTRTLSSGWSLSNRNDYVY